MSRWFRVYDDVINDPKLLKLPEATRWYWVAMLCAASKNDGALPKLDDLALHLRVAPAKATALLVELQRAGLIDKTETGFAPHNWDGRQYKSDVSTTRVKRFRERQRNVSETPPETETETETDNRIDVAVEASARGGSLVTPEALALTEKLLIIAGHDPAFWPPGWCGAPMRVQTWTDQGWKPDIIVAAVTSVAARKHGAPANSVNFFERAIAEEHAKQAAPLPKVEVREQQTITVNHGKPSSGVIQAADSLLARTIASFDGPGRGTRELRGPAGSPAPRLLSDG